MDIDDNSVFVFWFIVTSSFVILICCICGCMKCMGDGKAPLRRLEKAYPGSVFELVSERIVNDKTTYVMSVTVNGMIFHGKEGDTREEAQVNAARVALKALQSETFSEGEAGIPLMTTTNTSGPSPACVVGAPPPSYYSAAPFVCSSASAINNEDPVVWLERKKPGIKYILVSDVGRGHERIITMSVNMDESDYQGQGQTVHLAKTATARAAMDGILRIRGPIESVEQMWPGSVFELVRETMSDSRISYFMSVTVTNGETFFGEAGCTREIAQSNAAQAAIKALLMRTSGVVNAPNQTDGANSPPSASNPVHQLELKRPGTKYYMVSELGADNVIISVTVDGKSYQGIGRTEQLAKLQSAKAALAGLAGSSSVESPSPPTPTTDSPAMRRTPPPTYDEALNMQGSN